MTRIGSLAVVGGLVLGTYNTYKSLTSGTQNASERNSRIIEAFTGYRPDKKTFKIQNAHFTLPVLIGVGVHKAAVYIDLNKNTPKGINL